MKFMAFVPFRTLPPRSGRSSAAKIAHRRPRSAFPSALPSVGRLGPRVADYGIHGARASRKRMAAAAYVTSAPALQERLARGGPNLASQAAFRVFSSPPPTLAESFGAPPVASGRRRSLRGAEASRRGSFVARKLRGAAGRFEVPPEASGRRRKFRDAAGSFE